MGDSDGMELVREVLRDANVRLDEQRKMTDAAEEARDRNFDLMGEERIKRIAAEAEVKRLSHLPQALKFANDRADRWQSRCMEARAEIDRLQDLLDGAS